MLLHPTHCMTICTIIYELLKKKLEIGIALNCNASNAALAVVLNKRRRTLGHSRDPVLKSILNGHGEVINGLT